MLYSLCKSFLRNRHTKCLSLQRTWHEWQHEPVLVYVRSHGKQTYTISMHIILYAPYHHLNNNPLPTHRYSWWDRRTPFLNLCTWNLRWPAFLVDLWNRKIIKNFSLLYNGSYSCNNIIIIIIMFAYCCCFFCIYTLSFLHGRRGQDPNSVSWGRCHRYHRC